MRLQLGLILALSVVMPAHGRNVSFTFDDGPEMKDAVALTPAERNAAILRQLKAADVKAALFVTCAGNDDARLALLREWGRAGHLVANHSKSHSNFNSSAVTLDAFSKDVSACDEELSGLPGYKKLFRFPFLKEGNTPEKRDGFRAFLRTNGYRQAPVSIDTSDWVYNQRLRALIKEKSAKSPEPLREAYTAHLLDRAEYYDALGQKVLGRSVTHVLLLHHNLINAVFLEHVLAAFRARGWQIVSPGMAFKDSIYASEPNVLPAGESIIWSLAKDKGVSGLRYPAEDAQYEDAALKAIGL